MSWGLFVNYENQRVSTIICSILVGAFKKGFRKVLRVSGVTSQFLIFLPQHSHKNTISGGNPKLSFLLTTPLFYRNVVYVACGTVVGAAITQCLFLDRHKLGEESEAVQVCPSLPSLLSHIACLPPSRCSPSNSAQTKILFLQWPPVCVLCPIIWRNTHRKFFSWHDSKVAFGPICLNLVEANNKPLGTHHFLEFRVRCVLPLNKYAPTKLFVWPFSIICLHLFFPTLLFCLRLQT